MSVDLVMIEFEPLNSRHSSKLEPSRLYRVPELLARRSTVSAWLTRFMKASLTVLLTPMLRSLNVFPKFLRNSQGASPYLTS